ncbi:MAG: two-component system, OmpR family, sensor histidine kinase MprB [Solirubrobacteraceae bacterium]|jgi:two-component system sensor histidine kinase MprB|nr:two-component system, OmpR family, sensor histidine kinase MprB [Solirubrobacteraceae bacterium]
MTLRLRIAGVAGLAVALAVLAAAIGLYLAVRSDLRGQVDQSLKQRSVVFAGPPGALAPAPAPGASGSATPARPRAGPFAATIAPGARGALPRDVQPVRFGGASGYVQFLSESGSLVVPGGQGKTPRIVPSAHDRAIASRGAGRSLTDRTVKGTHLRVLTVGTPAVAGRPRGAVMIARPLTEVDHELSGILLILVIVGVAGIALAALLGALVARTALAPIVRFTRRTEALTGERKLSERLRVGGRDELARLAASFNTTLDALEAALAAQRQLIADASHELRTPIASLRANVQVLEDAERLPQDEQRRLRADIVHELDELTALVGDVVELARGASGEGELADVRLDEIVADAVAVAQRRGGVRVQLDLQPTIVRGDGARIGRAVSNLLDNARKWSPPDGLVEVSMRDGVLSVRDHGPGFDDADLPHVFERFYRSAHARRQPGSGLGLAIVQQAAEAHGGFARASNASGGGACLEVCFGAHSAPAPAAEPLAASPAR